MRELDIPKTAFVSPRGKYEFLSMPFEIKNASEVFQSLMTTIMRDCTQFAPPYMDDIVIYNESWDSHKAHVCQVLQC